MTRLTVALLFCSSFVFAAPRAQDVREAPPSKISIDFVAVDRNGAPVRDLKPDEIEVWIGHFRVPIERLTVVTPDAEERAGRVIVLLMDDVTIPPASVPRARNAAQRFVSRMLPGDQMALVTLSGSTSETTDDPARLRRALDDYNVRASGLTRVDVLSEHVLDTLASLSRQVTEGPGRRKTLVVIGSGEVFDRPLPPPTVGRDLQQNWLDAMRALSFAHMHLYVIDPSGVGSNRADSGQNGFARATGGRAFLGTNDLDAAVDQILRDASTYYVIGVSDPPVGRKSDLRDLEVRVLRRGVTALAPRAIPGGGS
jgi:VWFA-related protein